MNTERPSRTLEVMLAGCLAGWGGLLLELVWLRRHGLLLGNTASASAQVLALFLLGLGVGGLVLPRTSLARRRPLGSAAVLYAAVAVLGVLGDLLLVALPPLAGWHGPLLGLLLPGVPAVCMGGAFPLLFSVFDRHRTTGPGLLIGANLLGSVAAVFLGGNFLIPHLGLSMVTWLGVGGYGLAALLVAWRSRDQRSGPVAAAPPLPAAGRHEWTAAASGAAVLAIEVLMLRRLPFFLDGFQPTLSGVIAACLLGLTLGSVFAPPLCRRWFGDRAAAASVGLGICIAALGLHESVAPALGRLAIDSDTGFHLRILGAALASAGLPCFFLGATVPLCLQEYRHPETRAPGAGRLFFCQGAGSLAGALLVGHVLPGSLPRTFFLYALPLVGVVLLLVLWPGLRWWSLLGTAWVVLLGATGVTGGLPFRAAAAPVSGSRYDRPERYRYLEHRTDSVVTASVVYDRSTHGLILFTDEFRAAYIHADSGYMKVLGHLPHLLRPGLQNVAVLALGTGTTANAVSLWPDPRVLDVVEISPAVVALVDHFAKDGPAEGPARAPFAVDPRVRFHVTDGRRYVAQAAPGSVDLISMEPLLPYAPGTVPLYTREFYRLCDRALADEGLLVQWVPTHSMPRHYFTTLLATFARSFAHHSVWLLNNSTLLVGSKRSHLPGLDALGTRFAAMPAAARRDLHEAGLAAPEDLAVAFVGSDALIACGEAPDLVDDRPFLEDIGYWSAATRLDFLGENLEVLKMVATGGGAWPEGAWRGVRDARLQGLLDRARGQSASSTTGHGLAAGALSRARALQPQSVLLFEELARVRRELLTRELAMLQPFDAPGFAGRAALPRLRAHLARDPAGAFLWLARAWAEAVELDRYHAMQRALALDPTILDRRRDLRLPFVPAAEIERYRGPLEDLASLPAGEELVRRAAAEEAEALAFRTRYRVQVAAACLEVLRRRALAAAEVVAFRQVQDPAVLAAAVACIRARGGDLAAEALPLWRNDLGLPPGLDALVSAPVSGREVLAEALGGRRTAAELRLLGRLLLDSELSVRRVAAVALQRTVGTKVSYDPEWEASRRRDAVDRLEDLVRSNK